MVFMLNQVRTCPECNAQMARIANGNSARWECPNYDDCGWSETEVDTRFTSCNRCGRIPALHPNSSCTIWVDTSY